MKIEWDENCSCCGTSRTASVVVGNETIIVTEVDSGVSYALHSLTGTKTNVESALVPGGFAYNRTADDLAALGIEI